MQNLEVRKPMKALKNQTFQMLTVMNAPFCIWPASPQGDHSIADGRISRCFPIAYGGDVATGKLTIEPTVDPQ